jgi:hypothetical protein
MMREVGRSSEFAWTGVSAGRRRRLPTRRPLVHRLRWLGGVDMLAAIWLLLALPWCRRVRCGECRLPE